MTTPRNLADLSESELAAERQRYEGYVTDLQIELREAQKIVGELRAEQEQRELLTHPIGLVIGDKLLQTDESYRIDKYYNGFRAQDIGTECKVYSIRLQDKTIFVEDASGVRGVDLDEAKLMRQAWLDREAARKPAGE